MTDPGVLAVIIGRAGSKGLPGKNAMRLLGKPMICYTIEDALLARTVDRTIVSTDGPDIADAARDMNVPVIDRPAELAHDHATVDAAVRHAVEADGGSESIIVILYANVPVRPDDLLDRAVNTLRKTGADSVQSYTDVGKYHPAWMVSLDKDHRVSPYEQNTTYRRQDLPPLHIPDGGVIAVTHQSLFTLIEGQPHAFLGNDRRGITAPPGSVIDVDNALDLRVAESIFRQSSAVA